MRLIFTLIIFSIIACSPSIQRSNELRKKRAEAKTVTDLLDIGSHLDKKSKSYSKLKFDSIEIVDFRYSGVLIESRPQDFIFKRYVCNEEESKSILQIITSEKTYKDKLSVSFFRPSMIFVFYFKNKVKAFYFVGFGDNGDVYSSVKLPNGYFTSNTSEYGNDLFWEINCKHQFSNCKGSID